MAEEKLLQVLEVGPANATASVIWMHGLGADGYDFMPIVPELGLPPDLAVRFVFPHADHRRVTINAGMTMRAWYDITGADLAGRSQDEDGVRASARQIEALIAREKQRGVPAQRIVLAGFSQGGALALYVGLRHHERLAGIVALSCYLLLAERLGTEACAINHDLPIFFGHGMADPVVPLMAGEAAARALGQLGASVEWHTYGMPHAVHPQEITDIGRWLTARLASG